MFLFFTSSETNRTAHSFPIYFTIFAFFFTWILNCGLTIKREKKLIIEFASFFRLKIQPLLCFFKAHADVEGNERSWQRMSSTVGFTWIIQLIYLIFPRYFKMCCFDFWNVKILCLNEQSFPKLLFFPFKKFIGTCPFLDFFTNMKWIYKPMLLNSGFLLNDNLH